MAALRPRTTTPWSCATCARTRWRRSAARDPTRRCRWRRSAGRWSKDPERDTSSPTLPEDALYVLFTVSVSLGWIVEQGDVEAAFLNGKGLECRLILRAPAQGLPAIPGFMEAVPAGTCFLAFKGVYDINDAPNLWGGRHAEGPTQNGAMESTPAPRTPFWWFDQAHSEHHAGHGTYWHCWNTH